MSDSDQSFVCPGYPFPSVGPEIPWPPSPGPESQSAPSGRTIVLSVGSTDVHRASWWISKARGGLTDGRTDGRTLVKLMTIGSGHNQLDLPHFEHREALRCRIECCSAQSDQREGRTLAWGMRHAGYDDWTNRRTRGWYAAARSLALPTATGLSCRLPRPGLPVGVNLLIHPSVDPKHALSSPNSGGQRRRPAAYNRRDDFKMRLGKVASGEGRRATYK